MEKVVSQNTFDPHAKILHSGQYKIKKMQSISVPIRTFDLDSSEEISVQKKIDEMRAEIRELEEQIHEKRQISQEQANKILEQVKDEAKKVMEDAEQHAFDRVQKSVHEKETLLQQTHEDVDRILAKAEHDAQEIRVDAEKDGANIREQARKDGVKVGHEEGLEKGTQELEFAIERLHSIVAETARERERILVHSETQVINLVITMVSKIVKKLTAENQEVVVENTKAALELLRGAMTIFIRVSPHDFNFLSSFKEKLTRMIESRSDIKFIEDPTIDPGGVYIESDTGDIDATIRSQLEEIENQMRFYMPVKVKTPETKQREQVTEKNIKEQATESVKNKNIEPTEFGKRKEYISDDKFYTEDKTGNIEDEIIEPEIIEENSSQENVSQENVLQEDPLEQKIATESYQENSDSTIEVPDDDIIV